MSKKLKRVYVNIEGLSHTLSGKRKKWYTDLIPTYCCCLTPAYFIWERASIYNQYEPYNGYVDCKDTEVVG